jgi:hypothetical protein
MNAIVVVLIPGRNTEPLSAQTGARPIADLLPPSVSVPATAEPDQASPPLWTWFVENPRHYGA